MNDGRITIRMMSTAADWMQRTATCVFRCSDACNCLYVVDGADTGGSAEGADGSAESISIFKCAVKKKNVLQQPCYAMGCTFVKALRVAPDVADTVTDLSTSHMRRDLHQLGMENHMLRLSAARMNDAVCAVCMERTLSVAFVPCGHLCLCEECSARCQWKRCPVCRHQDVTLVRIYVDASAPSTIEVRSKQFIDKLNATM